ADPLSNGSEHGEAEEAGVGMIVAGCDAATVLEAVDEVLDAVSQGVDGAVDRVLHEAVLLGRDLGCAATGADVVANGVAVVASIGEQDGGLGVVLGHQVGIRGAVMSWSVGTLVDVPAKAELPQFDEHAIADT